MTIWKKLRISAELKRNSDSTWQDTLLQTVALGNDVPMESVQSMLGHADIKTTQIYAHVIDRKLSRDMDKMAKLVNNRNPKENAAIIKARMADDLNDENRPVLSEVEGKSKKKYLITDETFLFSKKGKLKEIQERDFFISVLEQARVVEVETKLHPNVLQIAVPFKEIENILDTLMQPEEASNYLPYQLRKKRKKRRRRNLDNNQ